MREAWWGGKPPQPLPEPSLTPIHCLQYGLTGCVFQLALSNILAGVNGRGLLTGIALEGFTYQGLGVGTVSRPSSRSPYWSQVEVDESDLVRFFKTQMTD